MKSDAPEILTLSNYIPEEVIDLQRFITYQGSVRINNFCTYVQNFMSRIIDDPGIHGAIIPNSCDSVRIARDYLAEYSDKFLFQLKHPLHDDANAVSYLSSEIVRMKDAISRHFDLTIGEDAIRDRMTEIDGRNRFLKRVYEHIEEISYHDYLRAVIGCLSARLADWKKHLDMQFGPSGKGARVYLVGPFFCDLGIVRAIEKFGLTIAGDYITNSQRLFSGVPAEPRPANIYMDIAGRILSRYPSPTLNNFKRMVSLVMEEIRTKNIRGVIFIHQMFCEPYEYVYPYLLKKIQECGIPVLKLQIENSSNNYGNIETKIETFSNVVK
jgi:benzoyl-CoA reductase/2-hydroxyglutaryl-CoA dehydratase subunit BcrC/BadD/HgdB